MHGRDGCPAWELLGTTWSLQLSEQVAAIVGVPPSSLPDAFWKFAADACKAMTFNDVDALSAFTWAGRKWWGTRPRAA